MHRNLHDINTYKEVSEISMILSTYCNYSNENGTLIRMRKHMIPRNIICCDKCKSIYEERSDKTTDKIIRWKKHFCKICLRLKVTERIVKAGTEYLKGRTKKTILRHSKLGGLACQQSPNKNITAFSSERWEKMSKEEKQNQVVTANKGLQEKLKDPKYRENHFEKIWKNSKIGYISKGQHEIFDQLIKSNLEGFELDGQFSSMKIDIIHREKKIAIEYNGDFWHCNPRIWSPERYNKAIKMTAKEKWQKDRNRKYFLERNGYKVIIIWESGWKDNKEKYLNRIQEEYNKRKQESYEFKTC